MRVHSDSVYLVLFYLFSSLSATFSLCVCEFLRSQLMHFHRFIGLCDEQAQVMIVAARENICSMIMCYKHKRSMWKLCRSRSFSTQIEYNADYSFSLLFKSWTILEPDFNSSFMAHEILFLFRFQPEIIKNTNEE